MLKAFGKLTKSKGLPPSEDQIRKHKEQKRQLEHWRKDVSVLTTILNNLKKEYEQHKEDFALGRYEELKDMIKSAVAQCREVVKENSNHRYDLGGSGPSGNVNSLCKNAESFAKQQDALRCEEKRYAELSAKDIDKDLHAFRKEILELKEEFRKHKQNLEKLGVEYEASKKFNPAQRYVTMKEMIKDVLSASSML